jgi:Rrf2 family protein
MLRLSKKGDYSVFLMATLARQELQHRGETRTYSSSQLHSDNPHQVNRSLIPTMSAHELSKLSGLGRSYVANLLKDFAKAGLLTSVRGQQGGYRLAKPPEFISLRETLAVIEGPLRFVGCAEQASEKKASKLPEAPTLSKGSSSKKICDLMSICPSVGPMQIIHNRIVHLLEGLSLAELAKSGMPQEQLAGLEGNNNPIES